MPRKVNRITFDLLEKPAGRVTASVRWQPVPAEWFLQWFECKEYLRDEFLHTDRSDMARKIEEAKGQATIAEDDEDPFADIEAEDEAQEEEDEAKGEVEGGVEEGDAQTECDSEGRISGQQLDQTDAIQCSSKTKSASGRERRRRLRRRRSADHIQSVGSDHIQSVGSDHIQSVGSDHIQSVGSDYIQSVESDHIQSVGSDTHIPPTVDIHSHHDTHHESKKRKRKHRAHSTVADREDLLRQLHVLRHRFKQARIPQDVENETDVNRLQTIVTQNVKQLQQGRTVAMYKLVMIGVLLPIEVVCSKFLRLNMSRSIDFHYANIRCKIFGFVT